MKTLAPLDARTYFGRMREKRVMVIGDAMLDEWIWGSVTRISPEAPVPVVAVTDHSSRRWAKTRLPIRCGASCETKA
jgi:hypothetical protein